MEINNSKKVKSVAFQGFQHTKTETGAQAYTFNCMYDSKKYDCDLEIFRVGKDKKNNFFIEKGCDGKMEPCFKTNVPKGGVTVEPDYDLDLGKEQPFAFRFALKDKETKKLVKYLGEDQNSIEGCTLVSRKGTAVTKQGPMYLAIADTFAPGYTHAGFKDKNTGELIEPDAEQKAEIAKNLRSANRTFSNTMGGTLAGLEAKVPELREAGYKRLITCPLKGGDNASSHKYWNENNLTIAGGIGNLNNYNSLQREAFKNGMNLVDDGTFTSEGLQGIHYQRAIKWMDNDNKPAEYYYFRMSGLQDGSLGLGVVPENYENLRHKVVNAPFDIALGKNGQYEFKENKQYDANQPTVLQIYDDSLASDEQKNDKTKIISKYAKTNTDNKLAMNTHDDTTIPYAFEIDPYEYKKNIENLNAVNSQRGRKDQISVNTPAGTMFVGSLSGISIEPKIEGGFVCWDANTDMVKMNYFTSDYDNELLAVEKDPVKRAIEMNRIRQGNYQVQDMAVSAGKYWTKHVRKVHNEYVAKTIGEISSNPAKAYSRISNIMDIQNPKNPKLPEDVRLSKEIVRNVLEDNYEMRPKIADYDILMNSSLMDLQLDSIEFANDTMGALSSPYLMKRATDKDHIGQSRYDAMMDETYEVPKEYAKAYKKMNGVFTNEIREFADKVLQEVDKNSQEKLFDEEGVTEYGQYVIPLVAEDIAKYAVVKALMPKVGVKQIEGGELAYDYDTMREKGTLRNLGINGDSQADEANQIVKKIRNGVQDLKKADIKFVADSINKRIQNTNTNSFKLAEVMVDRSGLGLDWRLDAAKDVTDMDAVKNSDKMFDTAWEDVMGFWGSFVDAVKSENPASYIVAELTDISEVIDLSSPDDRSDVIYDNEGKAISALVDIAGITSEANYSYFFNGISNLFGYDIASGYDKVNNTDKDRVDRLEGELNRFAKKPIDYKRNSYTFASNHDKPRIVHCLSMDMSLFHADLTNKGDYAHREQAFLIMNDIMDKSQLTNEQKNVISKSGDYFNNVSAKAVANGDLLRASIGKINEDLKNEEKAEISRRNISEDEKQRHYAQTDRKYEEIYKALSKSVADVVKGEYYKTQDDKHDLSTPDSAKKIGEKDGFGSKPIPDAFDIVYDQAVEKHGLKNYLSGDAVDKYRDRVDDQATSVGRTKLRIITRYLTALSGNPTTYAGDELGMTGYEDKCKNTYLQNRNPLDWSIVDKDSSNYRQAIDNYRNDMNAIAGVRKDDDYNVMEALNNGTMYKLDKLTGYKNGTSEELHCSAVMHQASNGAMNISVLNPNGITTAVKVDAENIRPTDVWLDSIYLKGYNGKISLDEGTTFKNVNSNDSALYKVCKNNDDYYIKRFENEKSKGDGILLNEKTAPDGVFMLYHVPDSVASQRNEFVNNKAKVREYFNNKYNIPQENGYNVKDTDNGGRNIDITSK